MNNTIRPCDGVHETFYGFRFIGVVDRDEWATHDGKTQLGNDHDILDYIVQNVETYKEIRITDVWDNLVMHIVEQELKFPKPGPDPHGGPTLLWNKEKQRFVQSEYDPNTTSTYSKG